MKTSKSTFPFCTLVPFNTNSLSLSLSPGPSVIYLFKRVSEFVFIFIIGFETRKTKHKHLYRYGLMVCTLKEEVIVISFNTHRHTYISLPPPTKATKPSGFSQLKADLTGRPPDLFTSL